jgi:hypothetical protein
MACGTQATHSEVYRKGARKLKVARSAEITLETKEVVVLRLRGAIRTGWCARCGGRVEILRAKVPPQARARATRVLAERFHVTACADGVFQICLTEE